MFLIIRYQGQVRLGLVILLLFCFLYWTFPMGSQPLFSHQVAGAVSLGVGATVVIQKWRNCSKPKRQRLLKCGSCHWYMQFNAQTQITSPNYADKYCQWSGARWGGELLLELWKTTGGGRQWICQARHRLANERKKGMRKGGRETEGKAGRTDG